jgi:acyl-CoA dehydrogenase
VDESDLRSVLSTVREFVRDQVVPNEVQIDESDEIPDDIRRSAKQMGLFGFAIPEEYGGLGLLMVEESRLVFELGPAMPLFVPNIERSAGVV